MLETYYAGVYWGPRKETAAECAQRASRFFQGLSACDASFQQWYQPGRAPRGQPGRALPIDDPKELEAFLLRGRPHTDTDHQVIEDLGFGVTSWNDRKNAAQVKLHCGGYSPYPPNSCVVAFPTGGERAERLLNSQVLAQVLTSMVTAWDADWGVVISSALRDLISSTGQVGTFAGWLTYLSHPRGSVPLLPTPTRIETVDAPGTLIQLTPERATASNPEHVELLTRVQDLLQKAGLLHPICP